LKRMEGTESLGRYLKREREMRNISLKEVSRNTRVREHLLRALEEDRYDLLPSATFVKGFLTSYAKYVGLDPNDALLRFQEFLKSEQVSPVVVTTERGEKKSYGIMVSVVVVGAVAVAFLALYYFTLGPSTPPEIVVPPKPEMTETVPPVPVPPESPPAVSTPSVPPAPLSPPAEGHTSEGGKPLSLELKAVERTWIRIQVDGQAEKEIMLQPGETISQQGAERIDLLVGNAGGLDLVFDGKLLERFGASGEVVTLIFTPQGVEAKPHPKPRSQPG
jgi:cytoskeleton protein RodZ